MPDTPLRVVVIGDELVAGAGDPRGLGWVGRVAGRTRAAPAAMFLPLAVPGETTTALRARWQEEVARRTHRAADNRLVVAVGRADPGAGVSLARTRLNLADILDVAQSGSTKSFVVGPPPGRPEDAGPIAELSAACADVAGRRRVPYVDTYGPLAGHEQWLADLAQGDGLLPGQAGYGLMAWLVLHSGWRAWLGLPDDEA